MVNHVETLLLNETESGLRLHGMGNGDPWYIDPEFSSAVRVPDGLKPITSSLFDGIDQADRRARSERVLSAVSLCMNGEILPFLNMLDGRRTIVYGKPKSIRGLYSVMGMSDSGFENGVVASYVESSGLFSSVGVPCIDKAVSSLAGIVRSCREQVVRFGAVVVLLAYQLDFARRRG